MDLKEFKEIGLSRECVNGFSYRINSDMFVAIDSKGILYLHKNDEYGVSTKVEIISEMACEMVFNLI